MATATHLHRMGRRWGKAAPFALEAAVAAALCAGEASAQVAYYWDPPPLSQRYWDTPNNWDRGAVPTPGSDVFLLKVGSSAIIRPTGHALSLHDATTSIPISGSGSDLTVTGRTSINGGGSVSIADCDLDVAYLSILKGGSLALDSRSSLTVRQTSGAATGSSFSNAGSVFVDRAQFTLAGAVAQLSGTTLTAGQWRVRSGTLSMGGRPIGSLGTAATVALDGGSARFVGLEALTDNAGRLELQNGASLTLTKLTNSGTLAVGAGSTLTAGALYGAGPVALSGGALVADRPTTLTDPESAYAGPITGTGSVMTRGAAGLRLTGANTFVGTLTAAAGAAFGADSDSALGDALNQVVLDDGGLCVPQSAGGPAVTMRRAVELRAGNGAIWGGGGNLTFDGVVSGVGRLYVPAGGSLRLRSASAYLGGTVVAGTLYLSGTQGSVRSPMLETGGYGGSIILDDDPAYGGRHAASNRVRDDATVVLRRSGRLVLNAAGQASSETIGGLRSESPWAELALQPGAWPGKATLTTCSIDVGAPGAAIDVVATGLGQASRLLLADAPPDGTPMPGWLLANGSYLTKYTAGWGVVPMVRSDFAINAPVGGRPLWLEPGAPEGPPPSTISSLSVQGLRIETAAAPLSQVIKAGSALTISGGGLVKKGAYPATISGGELRAGQAGALQVVVEGAALALESTLAGPLELRKRGSGTLRLGGTAANAFSGYTHVRGPLELAKPAGVNAVGNGLWVEGGTVKLLADEQIPDGGWLRLWNGATLDLNGHRETIDTLYHRGAWNLVNGAIGKQLFCRQFVSEDSAVPVWSLSVDLDTATLVLSGTGLDVDPGRTVTVGSGGVLMTGTGSPRLLLGASPAGGAATELKLAGDVTFTADAGTGSIEAAAGAVPGRVDLGGGAHALSANDGSAAVDLRVAAELCNGAVRKSGAGTARLQAASTYAGGTTLALGTLEATHPQALGSGPLTFAGGRLKLMTDAAGTVTFGPASGGALPVAASSAAASVRLAASRLNEGVTAPARFVLGPMTLGPRLWYAGPEQITLVAAGDVTLTADATFETSGGGFEVAGRVLGPFSLTKSGAGAMTLAGTLANAYAGTTGVQAGALVLAKPAGVAAVPGALEVKGSGVVRWLAANQVADSAAVTLNGATGAVALELGEFTETVGELRFVAGGTLRSGATGQFTARGLSVSGAGVARVEGRLRLDGAGALNGRTLVARDLDLTAGARLDLGAGGHLIIDAGDAGCAAALAEAQGWAGDGRDGQGGLGAPGAWTDGPIGVAVVRNLATSGRPLHPSFGEATGLATSCVLVALAPHGDVNLDGRVDAADYHAIDRGFALRLGGYANGDLDYSGGAPTVTDYLLVDQAFLFLRAAASSAPAPPPAAGPLPEPGAVALLLLAGGAGLLARHRRGAATASGRRTSCAPHLPGPAWPGRPAVPALMGRA